MKSFIPCIVLLFYESIFSQQLSGFEDIPFASSKEIVVKQMTNKNMQLGFEGDNVLGFAGGEYGSHKVYFWTYHFFDDKLHTVDIVFRRPDTLNKLREDIIVYITQKYGVESIEKIDYNNNLANMWYFQDESNYTSDLIKLNLYETSTDETTYTLTFVNIELFKESEHQEDLNDN